VIRTTEGWEAPGLGHYMWSPDQKWISANLTSGLWVISPDAATERLIAAGRTWREIVGWWQGAVVYLEYQQESLNLMTARPDEPARTVTKLPIPFAPADPFTGNYTIYGDAAVLFPSGHLPIKVNLRDGATQSLGTEPLPKRCLSTAISPSGRFALPSNTCDPSHLRVIDLEQWTERQVSDELYTHVAWSPVEETWAAISDTHLDIGDVQGHISHLQPPQPHKLNGGPYWYINGQQMAISAEVQPATDPRGYGFINEVWLFTPADQTWRQLATNLGMSLLRGWHPSGRYLVLQQIVSSAAPPNMGKLDVTTGQVQWLSAPPFEQLDPTRLDEELMIATGRGYDPRTTAFVPDQGSGVPIRVEPGQWTYMDEFRIRPPYTSWKEYRKEGPPTLVVVRR
jgi:hypothetical protein